MQVSARLEAILIPEYLGFYSRSSAPKSKNSILDNNAGTHAKFNPPSPLQS